MHINLHFVCEDLTEKFFSVFLKLFILCVFFLDLLRGDLDLLLRELNAICRKWKSIGQELGVDYSLNNICQRYSDPGDCLREVLKERLQWYSFPTWRDIVAALRTPDVAEPELADQLEAKYCPSESKKTKVGCS